MVNSSKHIKFLIGLPGSGKSYWLSQNVPLNNTHIIFDDMSQIDPKLVGLTNALNDPKVQNIYIADVNLINKDTYLQAKNKIQQISRYDVTFSQIIFIGELETCRDNVELRADGRNVKGTLERLKDKIYNIKNFLENDSSTTIIKVENYLIKNNRNKIR